MKVIKLTRGKVAIVDDEDFEELNRYKWHYNNRGYAARSIGGRKDKKNVLMHRVMLSTPTGTYVDHINGDKLDNRRVNLRLCTNVENCRNRGKQTNNKSGYKGVVCRSDTGKWVTHIKYNGTRLTFGQFDNKHDAARMYNFWAADLHGEFARLNKITEDEGER